jgi:hypothetical protein
MTADSISKEKTTEISLGARFVIRNTLKFIDHQINEIYFQNLIPKYMEIIFPVLPVLTEDNIRLMKNRLEDNNINRAFICAIGAAIIILSTMSLQGILVVKRQAEFLTLRVLDIRAIQTTKLSPLCHGISSSAN